MSAGNRSKNQYQYWLCLTPVDDGPGSYRIELPRMPSAWHRFWVHLVLGFHYTTTWIDTEGPEVRQWRHQMMSGSKGK